jgi:hypothetical protein
MSKRWRYRSSRCGFRNGLGRSPADIGKA